MAESILRLRVDSKEYDDKIKRAVEGLRNMERACHQIGGTLEVVEKDELAFVQALGKMDTQASGTRQQMRELQNAILDMQSTYRALSEAEKRSPFGQALQQSIAQLKNRAGTLQDQTADLREELRHMASDTAFTDSVNLMTSTVGACASAMVAWSGDSKEMEQVIKELAKIQTTVKAVEALTKAFQRQNLVLLKNPYALAAAAAATLAYTIYRLVSATEEENSALRDMQEIEKKVSETTSTEITKLDILESRLRDTNRSMNERRQALSAIKSIVKEYHADLTQEGKLINDNSSALTAWRNNIVETAKAAAAFDMIKEKQKAILENQEKLNSVDKGNLIRREDGIYGLNHKGGWSMGDMSSMKEANALIRENRQLQQEIDTLKNGISTDQVASTAVSSTSSHSSSSRTSTYSVGSLNPSLPYDEKLAMDAYGRGMDSLSIIEPDTDAFRKSIEDMTKNLDPVLIPIEVKPASGFDRTMARSVGDTASVADGLAKSFTNAAAAVQAWGQNSEAAAEAAATLSFAGTIASLAASMAKSLAAGTITIWDWIAGGLAGAAALGTMVASIKSAQENARGFSEGGTLRGSTYVGDGIPALLNAGETVFTAEQTSNLAASLSSSSPSATALPYVTGQHIILGVNNHLRSSGQGQLVTTKYLRDHGIL